MHRDSITSIPSNSSSDGDADGDVAKLTATSLARLQQLWRELGVARDEQAREHLALLRDVRGVYDRKIQFYRDEQELAYRRVAALRREIAHIRWLFRDDAPHEVVMGLLALRVLHDVEGLVLMVALLCVFVVIVGSLAVQTQLRFATSSRRWK